MNEKIKAARKQLGAFFQQSREEQGITREQLGAAIGVRAETIKGIESGRFAWDIDLHFLICRELGIKPYFSRQQPDDTEDYRLRREDDPERYHGFYFSENILLYPEQVAIVKLTFPRLFLRFNHVDSIFASFDEFAANITVQEWLDPNDKPTTPDEIESVLIDCWNFLALHEREEERQAEENNNWIDDDF